MICKPYLCARYVNVELCLPSQCSLHHKHSKCLYVLNQMRGEKLLVLAPILVILGRKGGRDGTAEYVMGLNSVVLTQFI